MRILRAEPVPGRAGRRPATNLACRRRIWLLLFTCLGSLATRLDAAVFTVTTTNNVNPPAGSLSLAQALANLHDGDTVQFNIPGTGPFYLATPANGYPLITNNNVTIDGYSQPGAKPNSNPILAPNNARLQIILDSRAGGQSVMVFPLLNPNDDPGYANTESAILGVVDGQDFHVQGIDFLGVPNVGDAVNETNLYAVAFARYASGGHVSGCWFGVAPDGVTLAGCADGVTGFRYLHVNPANTATNRITIDGTVVGVAPKSTNAPAEFNVFVEATLPVILEGNNTRISGNFLGVLPDGLHDDDVAFNSSVFSGDYQFQGAVEIGLGGNNTVIGTDGDGVNDENERNVIGGTLPFDMNGYYHTIEFYGNNPGTNIVVAGNYIGVGIDGKTLFTNGVPALNAAGSRSQYRVGSDFDGVSDALEANVIFNNFPPSLFPASNWDPSNTNATVSPEELSFLDELSVGATVSLRGNVLVDNFPFPVSPVAPDPTLPGVPGAFLTNYVAKALSTITNGLAPQLSTNSTTAQLSGTVPPANPAFPTTIIDLYLADPVGITNGQAANVPELPAGFVQGQSYLGSFVVGSTNDLSATRGMFAFDLSALSLVSGDLVTATANYSPSPPGTHNAQTLTSPFAAPIRLRAPTTSRSLILTSVIANGSSVTLAWSGGTSLVWVQMKTSLADSAWQNVIAVTNANLATIAVTNHTGFIRLQSQ